MGKQAYQVIRNAKSGEPEFAVVPWAEWSAYMAAMRDNDDEEDNKLIALAEPHRGEEAFPADVARRLVAGDVPLKVIREWRGLTQARLAMDSMVPVQYISQIERRDRNVGRKVAQKLAETLGVSAEMIMDI